MPNNDSHQHVVKTSAQWAERAVEFWVIPRGCLCVELTPDKKTKLKVGEGNKYYAQLPYVNDMGDLSDYYTKEEIDRLFDNLNRMAIMSTDEYDSKIDLPLTDNKLGDVRFVKSASPSIKTDPDVYLWNGRKWIFVGYDLVEIDLSQYIKRDEFEPVAEKVNEMYPKMHTHANKAKLDAIEEPYTTAEKEKLAGLENYDDTEIRGLIRQATHVHPNKSILDQIEKPFKTTDKEKLDSLENYDDTDLRNRVTSVESTAHTHSNKAELDSIYSGFVDEHEVLVEFKTIAENEIDSLQDDVADLKTKIHTHSNKNILDSTTAPYTREDKQTLTDLANITVFDGASATYDGFRGYVPAPRAGEQTYFLRGDGVWAKVKGGSGNKYKAGDGIYILSGEATSDTFPFNIYSRAATLKQYIIYGNIGGVGNLVDGHYQIPIIVSAPGHPNRTSTIIIDDPMYDGDYIDFEKQVFAHYRTDITSQVQHPSTDTIQQGISSTGNIYYKSSYQGWGGSPRLTNYFEIDPTASYEISPVHSDNDFSDSLNINVYDENQNRTRTIITSTTDATLFVPMSGEKYIRQSYVNGTGKISLLQPVETPCVLQNVVLYPNAINTINVGTTIKPNEIYVEVDEPIDPDPDDPMSEYTGIIYNDGVLDVTQEDPNALNEITVHFRESSKVLTIPSSSYTLPVATDSTLGGIIVGDNLSIDENGVLSADAKSTRYISGDGIGITTDDTTYTKLEYLKSTGSQYIMTDIVPEATYRTVVDMKFDALLSNPSGGWVFGSSRYNVRVFYRSWGMTEMAFYAGYEWYDGIDDSKTTIYNLSSLSYLYNRTTIILNRGASSFGSTTRTADVTISSQPTGGIVFFGQLGSDSVTPYPTHSLRIYDVKIYDSTNELLHQLVPAKRNSDNILGFYDIVTNTFYSAGGSAYFETGNEMGPVEGGVETKIVSVNIGSGLSFDTNDAIELDAATDSTLGGVIVSDGLSVANDGTLSVNIGEGLEFNAETGAIDVLGSTGSEYIEGQGIEFTPDPRSAELPNTYQQIEYLQGTGTQGIILNYTPMSTTPTDIKYELTYSELVSEPTGWHYLIGGWLQSSHKMPPSIVYSNDNYQDKLVLSMCETDIITNGDWPTGNTVHTSIVTIDGSTAKMQLDNGTESSGTWSGSIDHAPAIFASNRGSGTLGSFSAYKFRELKIYENDILIHHYYPCYRKSDNEPGIYDVITNTFLTNDGTGDFICGNAVNYDNTFINVKLGTGLHFDTNDAIAADKYLAGQGIEIGYHEGIVVTNPEYYFDTQVTCALSGSFYREFTKTTDEPALGALINCRNSGQSDSWTGPIFVGPTASSVKCSYNTDNVIGPFTYKGRTWFSTGTNYWVDGSLTDLNHHLPRIPGQEQNVVPDDINDFTVAKMIIDAAGFVESNNQDISAKLGNGLSFDSNDAIQADQMTGADGTNAGTAGIVPAPTATDNTKFLRGDGSWAAIETSTKYTEGDAIEFGHPGMTDLGFNFDTFVSKFTQPNNGTVSVDSVNKTFTLTATGSDAYTNPWAGGDLYTIPVVGGRKYRLTWDSNAPTVGGNVYAFENANTSHMHGVNQVNQNYLEFTADTTSNVNFRFGVSNSGDTITYSNIKFYEVDNADPDTNIINVKYGNGLSLDNNNALQVDEMVGATSQANGESGTVPQPLIADKDKFLKGDGTWSDPPTYTLPVATTSTLGGVKVGAGLSMNANDEIGVTSPYVTSVTNQGSLAGVITVAKSDGTSTDVDVLDNMRLILNCNYDSSLNQTQLGEPVNAPQAGMTESSPIIGDLTELEVT